DKRFPPLDIVPHAQGKMFKIRSMITGHGQEGEFIAREHTISVDGQEFTREVWKQCSENPVYPQGGTWVYARAGWCPGMATDLAEYDVTSLMDQGELNSFDYTVFSGSGDSRYVVNNQLVTYGAANFTRDAAIVEVRRPSDRVEFARYNPAATQPVVAIRNNGSETLTSLTIEYGVTGASTHTFEWKGSLTFLDTQHVTLPTPTSWGSLPTNTFVVKVMQPNGQSDEYAKNDVSVSRFEKAPVFPRPIIVRYRTNKVPEQNYYEIRDATGKIVHSNYDATEPSTTYFDSLTLAPGNYTFTFFDDGENGIAWWAAPDDGNGTLALRKNRLSTGTAIKSFNPDFGRFTQQDFIIEGTASVGDQSQIVKAVRVFPNPATSVLNVELKGYDGQKFAYRIIDMTGKQVLLGSLSNGRIDISALSTGSYTLELLSDEGSSHISFIKE
ncbi:MAG TPA: peptide-N-glycosidase F-related protein, partial [Candidatus Kapabacteria bacterium]|nr:peptide-N-glycosidase F-related protein [Candidatus Kapabacteria bacterium]